MNKNETEINASWFDKADPAHDCYSLEEYDFYQSTTKGAEKRHGFKAHRLTLLKNHKSGEYELVEFQFATPVEPECQVVIFKGVDLQSVLDRATERFHQAWKDSEERFVARP